MDILNISNSTLNSFKNVDPVANFQTMILERDTGAYFLLTTCKANFFEYVEYDISVKDVTQVNKVRDIGAFIQKFKI